MLCFYLTIRYSDFCGWPTKQTQVFTANNLMQTLSTHTHIYIYTYPPIYFQRLSCTELTEQHWTTHPARPARSPAPVLDCCDFDPRNVWFVPGGPLRMAGMMVATGRGGWAIQKGIAWNSHIISVILLLLETSEMVTSDWIWIVNSGKSSFMRYPPGQPWPQVPTWRWLLLCRVYLIQATSMYPILMNHWE